MSDIVVHERGDSPLVLSMPHCGTDIPDEIAGALNAEGLARADTDWWIDRLYAFAARYDPTVVRARLSRYVIDVNRDPSGASLYPGQATTDLCPVTTFDGEPIYRTGMAPDAAEIARRRALYFAPYHAALAEAVAATVDRHGYCLLYDCHSIRSVVPRLFPGVLPVFNIGTNGGAASAPEVASAVAGACIADGFDHVVDGRFRGGWITRHYGRPAAGVHALQMELAQRAYMREAPPWSYLDDVAARTQAVLDRVLGAMLAAGARLHGKVR